MVGRLKRMGASDLHLKVGAPPVVRVNGELRHIEGYESLRSEDVMGLLYQMIQEPIRRRS